MLRKYKSKNLPGTEWLNNLKVEEVEEIKNLINNESKRYEQVIKMRKRKNTDQDKTMQDSSAHALYMARKEQKRFEQIIRTSPEPLRPVARPPAKKQESLIDQILFAIFALFFGLGTFMGLGAVVVMLATVFWPILLPLGLILLYMKIANKI